MHLIDLEGKERREEETLSTAALEWLYLKVRALYN